MTIHDLAQFAWDVSENEAPVAQAFCEDCGREVTAKLTHEPTAPFDETVECGECFSTNVVPIR